MFLVVILLMIFLFESKPKTQEDPESLKLKQKISEEITSLQKSLDELKKEEARQIKILEELMKMPPEKIAERKKELQKKHDLLFQNLISLQKQQSNLQEFIRSSTENIKKMQEKLSEDNALMKKETEEIAENKKVLEKLKTQLEELKKAATFSVEQNSDKSFILAEFGKDGFMVKVFSSQQDFDLRIKGASVELQIEKFIDWVKTRDRDSELISVIMGPSKLKYWEDIAVELRKLSFGFGVEFYPDDDTTIFISSQEGGK